ncbi:uncharacterized protein LOC129327723 [Eublepharis macularius]|uniref:Uncharacterized protein LOC129327723 n=1 Tax=Eublepharis macularius TaxID=481883 RepID=A0AA97J6B9_EUBMA|nr:uncharacterized protein LOC129327723 [Eublepharis macularius]
MALLTSKCFEENVRLHFTNGIFELATLARCLLHAQKDPSLYAELREHITRASKELAEAEALTEGELERVNSRSLEIMESKKKLTDEQKRRREDLEAFNIRLQELIKLREENMKNCLVEKGMKMYTELEQGLAELEGEMLRSVRNAALWSMLLPGVGTVVGGIVAIKAHGSMKNAEKKAASAEDMVDHFRGNEKKYHQEVEKCTKLLKEQESSIQENQRRMAIIEEEKRKLVKFQEETLDLQEALRRCSHFVGILASKANAAEITSRYIFVYETLQYQLEDMGKHMLPLLGRKSIEAEGLAILSSPQMKRTVQKLKRFSERQNIFQCIYYDLEEYLLDSEEFSPWLILYALILFFLLAVFFSVIRFPWFYMIILFCLFVFMENLNGKDRDFT